VQRSLVGRDIGWLSQVTLKREEVGGGWWGGGGGGARYYGAETSAEGWKISGVGRKKTSVEKSPRALVMVQGEGYSSSIGCFKGKIFWVKYTQE